MKRFFKNKTLTRNLGVVAVGLSATQAYSYTAPEEQLRRTAAANTLESQLDDRANSSIINDGLDSLIEMLTKSGRIEERSFITTEQNCTGSGGTL